LVGRNICLLPIFFSSFLVFDFLAAALTKGGLLDPLPQGVEVCKLEDQLTTCRFARVKILHMVQKSLYLLSSPFVLQREGSETAVQEVSQTADVKGGPRTASTGVDVREENRSFGILFDGIQVRF
jgi:hypothetical protein